MTRSPADHDRLLDLLTDQSLFGLSESEQGELERLSIDNQDVDLECMDRIAAMIEVASPVAQHDDDLPSDLRARIAARIVTFDRQTQSADERKMSSPNVQSTTSHDRFGKIRRDASKVGPWQQIVSWAGWAVAAGLMAVLIWPATEVRPSSPPNWSAERESVLAGGENVIRRDWQATEDEASNSPTGPAMGDIVWDNEKQVGFMRFRGLAANDPTVQQYQLWIFDASREHPVDGGVFDIPAKPEDEIIIPITAKLQVRKPTMFAITIERPGGVVVSKKERIPLLAPMT